MACRAEGFNCQSCLICRKLRLQMAVCVDSIKKCIFIYLYYPTCNFLLRHLFHPVPICALNV